MLLSDADAAYICPTAVVGCPEDSGKCVHALFSFPPFSSFRRLFDNGDKDRRYISQHHGES